jgi:hypothetical protein
MGNQILSKQKENLSEIQVKSIEVNQETHSSKPQNPFHKWICHLGANMNFFYQISSNLEVPRKIPSNFIQIQTL